MNISRDNCFKTDLGCGLSDVKLLRYIGISGPYIWADIKKILYDIVSYSKHSSFFENILEVGVE